MHRSDDHLCTVCRRDFVVPVSLIGRTACDRAVVALECTNCDTAAIGVHDDDWMHEQDRRLDDAARQMQRAADLLFRAREPEPLDAFARALVAERVVPDEA